jgi:hypothetical protein
MKGLRPAASSERGSWSFVQQTPRSTDGAPQPSGVLRKSTLTEPIVSRIASLFHRFEDPDRVLRRAPLDAPLVG